MTKDSKEVLGWALFIIALFAFMCFMASCKGTTKIEKEYIHDTLKVTNVRYDSVDRWHTHYEYIKGDTVFKVDSVGFDRWHEKHDTIYEKKVEYRDKEKIKEVEKKVNRWWPGIIVGALCVAFEVYRFIRRRKG